MSKSVLDEAFGLCADEPYTPDKISVLDHGYVKLCESWGHGGDSSGDLEAGIISAARQSTQGSFRGWEKDERLLRYLYEHKHSTPFEFAGMTVEVQAPIFVFREWMRHRTQSYSEMSARYEPLPNLNYVPSVERLLANAVGDNKQAGTIKGAESLSKEEAKHFRRMLHVQYDTMESCYTRALEAGVPKELARLVLPVGRYSRMRATANLRNWLAFLTLRLDPSAQWEIRQYAQAVGEFIEHRFPRTWKLFSEGVK